MDIHTIEKVAFLARIKMDREELEKHAKNLEKILDLANQLDSVDTTDVEPLFHALEITQPLREDEVTETNQRAVFQALAPATEAGLYLVPQVIEEG